MKASLFVTCLVDQLYPDVGWAAVNVLRRAGVEVCFDDRQTCCGQPAFNTGYLDEARKVARHFVNVFEESERIVVPSGSCATMIRKFLPGLFPPESAERLRAVEISKRTYEFSEFLVDVLHAVDLDAEFRGKVTFHDSCHQLRELGVHRQPRELLRRVRGIDFVELEDSDRCCGFGGTFSVKFPEISSAIGADKVQAILRSGAEWVVSNDVSCLMHLEGLIRREKCEVKTMHLAQLLDRSHA